MAIVYGARTTTHHPDQRSGARFSRRAWWSLLGFVPSFALALLVGEGLISALAIWLS